MTSGKVVGNAFVNRKRDRIEKVGEKVECDACDRWMAIEFEKRFDAARPPAPFFRHLCTFRPPLNVGAQDE